MDHKNDKLSYYARHRIKMLTYQKEYYKKNRDRIRKKQNLYFYHYYNFGPYKNHAYTLPVDKTIKKSIIVDFQ